MKCKACGSDWFIRDASAAWNPKTKDWELSAVHDYVFCGDCGEEGWDNIDFLPAELKEDEND